MKKVILITFLMFISSVARADANADFREGFNAMLDAPQKAFEIGNSLDQQGDCRGNYILANLYLSGVSIKGNPVKSDTKKAQELLLKSASAGCGHSADLIATFYAGGMLGLPRDLNKAVYWYSKAFESDNKMHCESSARVAEIYNQEQNYTEAYNWYLKAKNSGSDNCGPKARLVKLQELEVKQQKQAEVMREDPPVAGIRLSLGGESKPSVKPKKKSKKKN